MDGPSASRSSPKDGAQPQGRALTPSTFDDQVHHAPGGCGRRGRPFGQELAEEATDEEIVTSSASTSCGTRLQKRPSGPRIGDWHNGVIRERPGMPSGRNSPQPTNDHGQQCLDPADQIRAIFGPGHGGRGDGRSLAGSGPPTLNVVGRRGAVQEQGSEDLVPRRINPESFL